MPVWPGARRPELARTRSMDAGDAVNNSELSFDLHTGTHIDTPLHVFRDGRAAADLDLGPFVGPASVRRVNGAAAITPAHLEALDLPPGTTRLLLRTDNAFWWPESDSGFRRDFVALTTEAARWLAGRGLKLIGVDYLSVQLFADSTPATHVALLERDIAVIEGLDLSQVDDGEYLLVCLPMRLSGAEGAPARAILLDQSFAAHPGWQA